MSPFQEGNISTYRSAEEIDEGLMQRYIGKKAFRVGAEERIVYEKVS